MILFDVFLTSYPYSVSTVYDAIKSRKGLLELKECVIFVFKLEVSNEEDWNRYGQGPKREEVIERKLKWYMV